MVWATYFVVQWGIIPLGNVWLYSRWPLASPSGGHVTRCYPFHIIEGGFYALPGGTFLMFSADFKIRVREVSRHASLRSYAVDLFMACIGPFRNTCALQQLLIGSVLMSRAWWFCSLHTDSEHLVFSTGLGWLVLVSLPWYILAMNRNYSHTAGKPKCTSQILASRSR